jgi:hypothetical protein
MNPVFVLEIPREAIAHQRIFASCALIFIAGMIVWAIVKMVIPTLRTTPLNKVALCIGLGTVILFAAVMVVVVFNNFVRNPGDRKIVLYETGVQFPSSEQQIPFKDVHAEWTEITGVVKGYVIKTGDGLRISVPSRKDIQPVTLAVSDSTGISKRQADDFMEKLEQLKRQ